MSEAQLEVGVSGCSGLVQDPERGLVCLTRKTRPLYLWLNGETNSEFELTLWFDDDRTTYKKVADPVGLLLEVNVPRSQGRLRLNSPAGTWALEIVEVSSAHETVRQAVIDDWKTGNVTAALDRIDEQAKHLDPREAGLLGCLGARIALAERDLERLFSIAKRLDKSRDVSCVGKSALLIAYVHLYLRPDFNAVEQSLRAAESVQAIDLDSRIGTAYLRGVLKHRLGQIDESLLDLDRAARLARHVGDGHQHASALVMRAVSLARLGRFKEAEALATEVEQRTLEIEDANLALEIRSNVAWIAVLRREDDPSLPDPSAELREMLDAYIARGDRRNVANRRLDLALTLVQNRDLDSAKEELEALDPGALDPDLLVWFELTAARIELLRGRFNKVEAPLNRARLLAELNQDRELQWHVAITRADLERARGHDSAAISAYSEASSIADELALSVAGDAGRSRFVTTHSRADIALVQMLLERGDAEAAMCAAMGVRARHLRGLWVRLRPALSPDDETRYRTLLSRYQERKQEIAARLQRSWELSTEELQVMSEQIGVEGERADQLLAEATALIEEGAPIWSCLRSLPNVQGDAVITMAPELPGAGWIAFLAWRRGGELVVETAKVEVAGPSQVDVAAANALDRLSDSIRKNSTLRIVPVGDFMSADFQRLWRAREANELTIIYSLGLGRTADTDESRDLRAAVVGASTDLAAVTDEVTAVAERLARSGWTIESQWSPAEDSQPVLLHYAGHGFQGGSLGWQSALELPELGKVTAAQIVAGQRAPEVVVLGACSAGRLSTESIDGGMNLAAAFLLAGARLVIAPTRDVDDTAALSLARELYQEGDAQHLTDPAVLARTLAHIQAAQIETSVGPKSYSSWRAWVP